MQKLLYIYISLITFTSSLLAQTANTGVFKKLEDTGNAASKLFNESETGGGAITKTAKYIVMFLGVIIFSMGIHETFMAEDRGGEGKKTKGVMKMIGGGLFIAISSVIGWIVT